MMNSFVIWLLIKTHEEIWRQLYEAERWPPISYLQEIHQNDVHDPSVTGNHESLDGSVSILYKR